MNILKAQVQYNIINYNSYIVWR